MRKWNVPPTCSAMRYAKWNPESNLTPKHTLISRQVGLCGGAFVLRACPLEGKIVNLHITYTELHALSK